MPKISRWPRVYFDLSNKRDNEIENDIFLQMDGGTRLNRFFRTGFFVLHPDAQPGSSFCDKCDDAAAHLAAEQ